MTLSDEKTPNLPSNDPANLVAEASQHSLRLHGQPALTLATGKGGEIDSSKVDFDPCEHASPYSPFYNHDTPRPSTEAGKLICSPRVTVRDLEAQTPTGLTPYQTTEALPESDTNGTKRSWVTANCRFGKDGSRYMVQLKRPRKCPRISDLPKGPRILVRIVLSFFLVAAMVGVGIGISLKVGGGVYRTENSSSKIAGV